MENIALDSSVGLTFILAASALHGIWLAVLLFFRLKEANLLSLVFIIYSCYLINYLLFLTGAIRSVPHLLGVLYPLLFLIGPCFYFFVKRSLVPGFRFSRLHFWHIILPVLAFIDTIELYIATSERKLRIIEYILSDQVEYTWYTIIVGSAFLMQMIFYVGAAWWLARQTEIKQTNEANQLSAKWYKQFCLFLLILLFLDLTIRYVFFALKWKGPEMEMVIASLVALGIQIAGYKALGRLPDFPKIIPILRKENGNGKYKTSSLTPMQMEKYQTNLFKIMQNEKPYLNPTLKISDLASLLNIPSHQLSQVLNEGIKTNFYDFVNKYRVETAMHRLKDDKYSHYSILAIGLECGFANKTTFNRAFKKRTGMTPSKYLDNKNITLQ